MPSTVKQALLGASVVVGMVVFFLRGGDIDGYAGLDRSGQSATIVINGDEIVIAGGDGLLAQGSPAVQENVCRAITRAAEVTLSRYAAAFELQLKLAEWSRRASISV